MRRLAFPLALLCAAAGVLVSLELVGVHVRAHFGGGGDTGLCAAAAGFSCEATSLSAFSEVAGLPIAVLGAGFYAALLVLLPLHRLRPAAFPAVPGVLTLASLGAVGYSLVLFAASVFVIGKACPYCMVLYALNFGLAGVALWSHPQGPRAALREVPGLWRRFELWVFAVLVTLGTVGFQGVYAQQSHAAAKARAAAQADPTQPEAGAPVTLDLSGAPSKGPADAPVTIVEFSDFQCPYCRRFTDILEAFAASRSDVRVVFRHYPMDESCNPQIPRKFHEFACGAARAAVCAQAQGKFWPMHDRLFAQQDKLTASDLQAHAQAVGAELVEFDACMAHPDTAARLRRDIDQGAQVGIEGTPTFFVNGLKFVGGRSPEELTKIVDAARGLPAGSAAPASASPVSGSAR